MTGGPVLTAASAGAARRLVQSVVVLGLLAASSAAALLGLTLLTSANQGFYAAFTAQHGADLAVTINASKATAAELARTRHLSGVTQAAGPYREAPVTVTSGGSSGHGAPGKPGAAGFPAQQLTVVGRASPAGPLDHVVANPSIMDAITHHHSRWPARTGEIALAQITPIRLPPGSKLTVTSAPGKPMLTIVGYVGQAEPYDQAWVTPGQIAALRAKGAPAQEEMFYSFTHAATDAQVNAGLAELKRALPAGAIAGWQSWLTFKQGTNSEQAVNTPFVTTFAVIALVLAVLIVANVVAAAVIASYRRIGVLKSIGFTPAQVTAAYLAQIGLPAIAGAVVGTVLGDRWVLPVIKMSPLGGSHASVPLWINLTVPLAMCALAGLAAAVPAVRAGRLSAVAAIAAGQAPRAGHGYAAHRLAGRLALPRPVTIGLAAPFSRPAPSAVTLAAITFGLAAVVLAAGLSASTHKINHSAISGLGQVQVSARGSRSSTLTPSQSRAVLAALRTQPATLHYIAESDLSYIPPGFRPPGAPAGLRPPGSPQSGTGATVTVTVPGLRLPLDVYAYASGSAWLGWNLISGRWYRGPREADASSALLAATGLKVGDLLTLKVNGKPVTARIAGEAFVPSPGPALFTSWQTLGAAVAGLTVNSYDIDLKPGTSTGGYISALSRALGTGYLVRTPSGPSIAFNIRSSYFHLLAVLVTVLAVLGVLNSVLMATRERVHDLGVYKALGMTPRQTITMVICWVIAPTIIAAIIALPIGLIAQDLLVRRLAADAAGMVLPGSFVHVLSIADLLLLALAGLGIAAAGALGPATWAAASKTTTALHAE